MKNENQSLGSSVPYASELPLRGDDLLDSVLEAIRLVCKKLAVTIIVCDHVAEIRTADSGIKLGELVYASECRIGYTRTAYTRTIHPDPQTTSIQKPKEP